MCIAEPQAQQAAAERRASGFSVSGGRRHFREPTHQAGVKQLVHRFMVSFLSRPRLGSWRSAKMAAIRAAYPESSFHRIRSLAVRSFLTWRTSRRLLHHIPPGFQVERDGGVGMLVVPYCFWCSFWPGLLRNCGIRGCSFFPQVKCSQICFGALTSGGKNGDRPVLLFATRPLLFCNQILHEPGGSAKPLLICQRHLRFVHRVEVGGVSRNGITVFYLVISAVTSPEVTPYPGSLPPQRLSNSVLNVSICHINAGSESSGSHGRDCRGSG